MRCSVCDGDLPNVDENGEQETLVQDWWTLAQAMAPTKCTCPPKDLVGEMPEDEEEGEDWSCQEWYDSEKDRFDSLFGPDEEEESDEDPYGF